jgi:hypothetical protein
MDNVQNCDSYIPVDWRKPLVLSRYPIQPPDRELDSPIAMLYFISELPKCVITWRSEKGKGGCIIWSINSAFGGKVWEKHAKPQSLRSVQGGGMWTLDLPTTKLECYTLGHNVRSPCSAYWIGKDEISSRVARTRKYISDLFWNCD